MATGAWTREYTCSGTPPSEVGGHGAATATLARPGVAALPPLSTVLFRLRARAANRDAEGGAVECIVAPPARCPAREEGARRPDKSPLGVRSAACTDAGSAGGSVGTRGGDRASSQARPV